MKVVILCGGKGTRLREETEFRPKPMVKIGGKPILWHIMKTYSHFGYNEFVLCLGYQSNIIKIRKIRLVIYDNRPESSTHGNIAEYQIGRYNNYYLIHIPPMLWYGFQSLDRNPSLWKPD